MFHAFLYGIAFIIGATLAVLVVFFLVGALDIYRKRRDPEWGGTHKFIKSLPLKKGKQ